MAVLTGPLMSLGASGTIAKTITYGTWKGIPYARTRVIPSNPQSAEQVKTREVFRYIGDLYKYFDSTAREPWIASVKGIPMTPQNMIARKNVTVLRDAIDLTDLVLSPGAAGGPPPTSIVVTPGTTQLSVAVNVPTAPTGWTLTAAQGVVVLDQDPHDVLEGPPVSAEDLTSTFTLLFNGLTTASLYQVGVWLKWMTPNLSDAYSIALRDTGTPT